MQRIEDRAAKFKVGDVPRDLADYMMDWLAETDKENDIATTCQKTKRGVLLGSRFCNKVATEGERAEYSKGLSLILSEIIPGGLWVIFKNGESGTNSITPLM